jgi:hypothetical protein
MWGNGIRYYAQKWQDAHLRRIGDGILSLILNAPRSEGAFLCIYNFDTGRFEGTLHNFGISQSFRFTQDELNMKRISTAINQRTDEMPAMSENWGS